MKKYMTFLLLLAVALTTATAENNGRRVLDKAANYIKKSGDVRVTFSATSFSGTDEQGTVSGTMLLQGNRFCVSTDEMQTWFDGKTQWTYVPENGEVNVTEPTEKEMQAVNPYSFMQIYKKGYRTTMRESTLRGEKTYEVHLLARNADNAAQEIYVDVRQSDYRLLCVRVRQDNIWNRISLKTFAGNQNFSGSEFTFPKEKYPDVEIIDLR
ncbi:MAG: hypothetical protein II681_01655 [Bacteroidaceae bacterium]|nr:hypothetical protein [Bacteroidaceae bacterium]MBQ3957542.1 hypothetical protein [Bacteroidaceae bacterium]